MPAEEREFDEDAVMDDIVEHDIIQRHREGRLDASPEGVGGLRGAWRKEEHKTVRKSPTPQGGHKTARPSLPPTISTGIKVRHADQTNFPSSETHVAVPDGFLESLSMAGWQRAGIYLEVMGRVVRKHIVLGGIATALGKEAFSQVGSFFQQRQGLSFTICEKIHVSAPSYPSIQPPFCICRFSGECRCVSLCPVSTSCERATLALHTPYATSQRELSSPLGIRGRTCRRSTVLGSSSSPTDSSVLSHR